MSTKSKGKSLYYILDGKRETGESDEQTLVREIKEELAVNIAPGTLENIGTFIAQSDGAMKGVMLKMTCYKAEYQGDFRADSEIEEIAWLDSKDLGRISEVDKIIFRYLINKGELG